MASNILSRLLPSTSDEGQHPPARQRTPSDVEQHADMAIDEENLGERFQDQDLDQLLAEAAGSEMATESTAFLQQNKTRRKPGRPGRSPARPKWMKQSPVPAAPLEEDDDVPESLLLEGDKHGKSSSRDRPRKRMPPRPFEMPPPVPGPSTQTTRAQWEATRAQQRLHGDSAPRAPQQPVTRRGGLIPDPKERAMWRWANVENLDRFLRDVYDYYEQHGIWSICLYRALRLLTVLFVMTFVTFLLFCVNFRLLPKSQRLEDVLVPKCTQHLPWYWNMCLWLAAAIWIWQLIQDIREVPRLWEMHNFFLYLLDIPDSDIQTVSWQYVVKQLMELRKHNFATAEDMPTENRRFLNGQSKQRMDAHDIANRLMRIENYWIALVNKEILDCTVNIPFIGKRQFYTKVIEWNLGAALTDFVFDDTLQVKPQFRSSKYRRQLIMVLKRRFFIIGCLCVVGALPLACYFIVREFFMMFTEYQKNPAELGARNFSPMALWKFREFNEVNHIFERRTRMALPYANRYLEQFPKDKMAQLFRFTAFVSGALAAVLGLITIFDSQLFLGFEIAGHTSLFWLSILTPIYMAARAAAPDEEMVLDPEFALRNVIECTHYSPASWVDRLHSDEVRQEFSALYQLKLVLWLEELASIMIAPFVFIWSLPNCAEQLVDFFREFTIHVDGLGHVCSFAVFDFKRPGDVAARPGQRPDHLRDDYFGAKDNKLMESYYHFMDIYGENPTRRGNRHQTRRRPFLPPPNFPAIGASGAFGYDVASRYQTLPGGVRGGQSVYQQTPRFGPVASHGGIAGAAHHASPMHSILLDPHHQPRQSPRQPPHRQRSRLDGDLEDVEESAMAEGEGGTVTAQRNIPQKTSSKVLEEDSELGDSWALKAQGREEQDAKNEDGVDGDKGVGVLGLLYQFQKAQTEGRAGTHL